MCGRSATAWPGNLLPVPLGCATLLTGLEMMPPGEWVSGLRTAVMVGLAVTLLAMAGRAVLTGRRATAPN